MTTLTDRQQRRRANEKGFRKLRALWARVKGVRPEKDPEYLAFLRTQRCAIPDCTSHFVKSFFAESVIEAAHVGAIRGLRQKCSDLEAIPLCAYHHRIGPHSHHQLQKSFWLFWSLDREAEIAKINALYEEWRPL